MSEVIEVFVTTTQRQLLWKVIQYDVANQVLGVVADSIPDVDKAQKIITHMDFIWEIRVAMKAMPPQGGAVGLSEIARAYLIALLEAINDDLLEPQLRATFARDSEDLRMKLGDLKSGFLLPYIKQVVGSS